MKRLNVGLFGCGTVGSGLWKLLHDERERIARATGTLISITRVCVLDPAKERPVELPPGIVTTDGASILDDPAIDVIVEVIGGDDDATGIITRALVNGKRVVTANKLVVARNLPRLRLLEELHGGRLFYGASVCGSVPILKVIDETLMADRVTRLRGVVNGSTNYILSRRAEGASGSEALAAARAHGFLEADPSADLSGADAAYKLSILAYHAFGRHVPPHAIPTTGIDAVTDADIAAAHEGGAVIKLVAEAIERNGMLILEVAPRVIPLDDPLAQVRDEVNIVELTCEGVGVQRFVGKGAGSIPTANAVLTDLVDIIANRRYRSVADDGPSWIPQGTSPDYGPMSAHGADGLRRASRIHA